MQVAAFTMDRNRADGYVESPRLTGKPPQSPEHPRKPHPQPSSRADDVADIEQEGRGHSAFVRRRQYRREPPANRPLSGFMPRGPGRTNETRGLHSEKQIGRRFIYCKVRKQPHQTEQRESLQSPEEPQGQNEAHNIETPQTTGTNDTICIEGRSTPELKRQQRQRRPKQQQADRVHPRGSGDGHHDQESSGARTEQDRQREQRTQYVQQHQPSERQFQPQQKQQRQRQRQQQQEWHQRQLQEGRCLQQHQGQRQQQEHRYPASQRDPCQPQRRQQEQEGKQQLLQRQQRQGVLVSRPVCSRPRVSPGLSSVVMELRRLRRLYSTSFRFISCHPLLMALLEQHDSLGEKEGSIHIEAHPVLAGNTAETQEKRPHVVDYRPPATVTSGEQLDEGAASSQGLCKFELVLMPTDPEFDATALPHGLKVHVNMGKDYPGGTAVLAAAPTSSVFSGEDKISASQTPEATTVPSEPQNEKQGEEAAFRTRPTQHASSPEAAAKNHIVPSTGASFVPTLPIPLYADARGLSSAEIPDAVPCAVASLRVCNKELNDLRCSAIEAVFQKVIEKQLKMKEEEDLIRTALRAIDRHLREIFELEGAPPASTASQKCLSPWTPQEQRKLEEAVVLYRRVADPVLRWRNISSHVGSRSAKECAMRFQICRQSVLQQREMKACNEDNGNEQDAQEESLQSRSEGDAIHIRGEEDWQPSPPGDGSRRMLRGCDVSLIEPVTDGVSSLHLSCARLQVACGRCKAAADMRISLPKDGATLEPAGCALDCAKCRLRLGLRIQPVIAVGGSSPVRVAVVEPTECLVKDLLPCDFILTCDCCAASVKAREVLSGPPMLPLVFCALPDGLRRRSANKSLPPLPFKAYFWLPGCCSRSYGCIRFGPCPIKPTRPLPHWCLEFVDDLREAHSSNTDHRQRKQDLRIVIGSPLVDFGTCKHYKKSFRWLRFPCCGKAYPCDVCHDSSEDHEHEWATRMICGFCSVEQPFANGKPCACGKALTKDGGSAHWEGGKGCRDPVRMSRKDSKKYKLQTKQHRKA